MAFASAHYNQLISAHMQEKENGGTALQIFRTFSYKVFDLLNKITSRLVNQTIQLFFLTGSKQAETSTYSLTPTYLWNTKSSEP